MLGCSIDWLISSSCKTMFNVNFSNLLQRSQWIWSGRYGKFPRGQGPKREHPISRREGRWRASSPSQPLRLHQALHRVQVGQGLLLRPSRGRSYVGPSVRVCPTDPPQRKSARDQRREQQWGKMSAERVHHSTGGPGLCTRSGCRIYRLYGAEWMVYGILRHGRQTNDLRTAGEGMESLKRIRWDLTFRWLIDCLIALFFSISSNVVLLIDWLIDWLIILLLLIDWLIFVMFFFATLVNRRIPTSFSNVFRFAFPIKRSSRAFPAAPSGASTCPSRVRSRALRATMTRPVDSFSPAVVKRLSCRCPSFRLPRASTEPSRSTSPWVMEWHGSRRVKIYGTPKCLRTVWCYARRAKTETFIFIRYREWQDFGEILCSEWLAVAKFVGVVAD